MSTGTKQSGRIDDIPAPPPPASPRAARAVQHLATREREARVRTPSGPIPSWRSAAVSPGHIAVSEGDAGRAEWLSRPSKDSPALTRCLILPFRVTVSILDSFNKLRLRTGAGSGYPD